MKTKIDISLTKEDLRKAEKAAHRNALIELGMYAIPTHKIHKNKKAYNRKKKHKSLD